MFEKELEVYQKNKAALRVQNPSGGFVVINGDEILGVWQSRTDALKQGIEKYGNVPFLVRDIQERQPIFNFSRHMHFTDASLPK